MQVQEGRHTPNAYRGMLHGLSSIVKNSGVPGLYQGLGPNLVGSGLSWGLYFFFYNKIKEKFRRRDARQYGITLEEAKELSPAKHLASATFAGSITCVITNPVWMIKTRMQLQDKRRAAGAASLHGKPYRSMID